MSSNTKFYKMKLEIIRIPKDNYHIFPVYINCSFCYPYFVDNEPIKKSEFRSTCRRSSNISMTANDIRRIKFGIESRYKKLALAYAISLSSLGA